MPQRPVPTDSQNLGVKETMGTDAMADPDPRTRGRAERLCRAMADLAATPDDAASIDELTSTIAQLAVDTVRGVAFASVTAYREGRPVTVAATSDLAAAVDGAQYASRTGPCLDAIESGRIVSVPNTRTTMQWPGFREAALSLGVVASLSVPLFAASGTPLAGLNLYSREPRALEELARRLNTIHDGGPAEPAGDLGPGGRALLDGVAAAWGIRLLIQQAIEVLVGRDGGSADVAYRKLRLRAAELGTSIVDVATAVVT